jgi:HPt (histidine-containing phosphotransfer) domain-containing protein
MTAHDERMAVLRERFLARAERDRLALIEAEAAGDGEGVRRIAHGLAGASGTFGFPELGTIARSVEYAEEDEMRSRLAELLARLAQPR